MLSPSTKNILTRSAVSYGWLESNISLICIQICMKTIMIDDETYKKLTIPVKKLEEEPPPVVKSAFYCSTLPTSSLTLIVTYKLVLTHNFSYIHFRSTISDCIGHEFTVISLRYDCTLLGLL